MTVPPTVLLMDISAAELADFATAAERPVLNEMIRRARVRRPNLADYYPPRNRGAYYPPRATFGAFPAFPDEVEPDDDDVGPMGY